MAVRYYCDGCDDQIGEGSRFDKRTRNKIEIDYGEARGEVSYDLCGDCLNRVDPKKWPRSVMTEVSR